jgi:hypothetical protein
MEFNFSQNTVLDSLDKVPADFQGLYRKDDADGKFKLDSDHPGVKSAISAITGLNSALTKVRGELVTTKAKAVDLSALADYGATPEEIVTAFTAKLEEASKGKGKGVNVAEEVEKAVKAAKEALGKTHAEELQKHSTRNEALKNQLYGLMVTNTATSALIAADVLDPTLLMPFIREQVKVEEEDGKFKVTVVNEAGDTRYSGSTGEPMSIKELVTEMKATERYMPLFKSDAPTGGGASSQQQSRRTVTTGGEEKTSKQKIASGLDRHFGKQR